MDRRRFVVAAALAASLGPSRLTVAQDSTSPLEARLGGSIAGFQARYGPALPPSAADIGGRSSYDIAGFSSVMVHEIDGIISTISLFAPRPAGEEWEAMSPHPMNWTFSEADAIAKDFLPADSEVTIVRDDHIGLGVLVTEGTSAALAATVPEAIYAELDDVYAVGQWSTAYFLTMDNSEVNWISVDLEVETPPDDL